MIQGAAREPEIVDLQGFLRAMGAEVSGAGTSVITIRGGVPLHPAEHCVMGDGSRRLHIYARRPPPEERWS